MTAVESVTPFVGRTAELDVLRAELAKVRSGSPRMVVIEGDAGIGKTVLIERLLATEYGLTVLRATGEPWESYVAYGVVDQIMRVAGVSTARLLVSRDRSFPAEEPVGVGGWILDVLTELEQKAPVAVVVDDAHWADIDSLRALLFAARRLVDERVLLVLGQRVEDEQRLPEGLRRLAGGRTGATIALQPLPPSDVHELATALGVRGFSTRAARRLHTHTGGNALYVKTMLSELPEKRWRTWNPSLPRAARLRRAGAAAAGTRAARRPGASWRPSRCSAPPRRWAARPSWPDVPDLFVRAGRGVGRRAACRCARTSASGRWRSRTRWCRPPSTSSSGRCAGCSCTRRPPEFVEDEGALLRHRVLATTPPNADLAGELEAFARREASRRRLGERGVGAGRGQQPQPPTGSCVRSGCCVAVDATVGAGDLHQAESFARDVASFGRGAWRDAALGYLAILRGRRDEAEELLRPRLAAVRRRPGHLGGRGGGPTTGACTRSGGCAATRWSSGRRARSTLARPGDPVRVEAEALLGLGMGWQGQIDEGMTAYEALLGRVNAAEDGPQLERIRMAHGWLRLVRRRRHRRARRRWR